MPVFVLLFANSKVEFTWQQANVVTHALALEATLITSSAIYFQVPDCIVTLISNEML